MTKVFEHLAKYGWALSPRMWTREEHLLMCVILLRFILMIFAKTIEVEVVKPFRTEEWLPWMTEYKPLCMNACQPTDLLTAITIFHLLYLQA